MYDMSRNTNKKIHWNVGEYIELHVRLSFLDNIWNSDGEQSKWNIGVRTRINSKIWKEEKLAIDEKFPFVQQTHIEHLYLRD